MAERAIDWTVDKCPGCGGRNCPVHRRERAKQEAARQRRNENNAAPRDNKG